jgi:tetratricopeptide (TPR) repeat protein
MKEVESLVQKAQQAVASGENAKAREYYEKALTLRGDLPNVHYGLATVHYLMGDLPNAAQHFKEVTRLDPLRAGAFINLGAVFNKLDRLDDAIAALRRGIQLDLNRPEGYYNLGLVYRRKGQMDLAIQAYREATRVQPRMTDAHYNLANLYLEKGQYNLAITHYEEALEHRPTWEKALSGLDQARAALQEEMREEVAETPTSAFADPDETDEAPTQKILDPERLVDPNTHGSILADLHRVTKESEQLGREFVQMLEAEIEPAIKILSNCLLYTNRTSTELDQCVQKVEDALVHMHTAQKRLQISMEKVRGFGEKLVQS